MSQSKQHILNINPFFPKILAWKFWKFFAADENLIF